MSREPEQQRGSERGQAVALAVMAMVGVLGVCAMVVDVGWWYVEKRRAQSAADAAAMAAAHNLPLTSASLVSLSPEVRTLNEENFGEGAVAFETSASTLNGSTDTVTARARARVPGFFSRVLGLAEVDVEATATARIETYRGWGWTTAPWAIDEPRLRFDVPVTVKVDPGNQVSPGNFGALDLTRSPGCVVSNGAANYEDMIAMDKHSCGLEVGGRVWTKTGNMRGPTDRGLAERGAIRHFDLDDLYVRDADGRRTIKDLDHPNVAVIPIIDAFNNGYSPVRILSFEYFIITDWEDGTVSGQFVHDEAVGPRGALCPTETNDNALCETGPFTPDRGISTARLVG